MLVLNHSTWCWDCQRQFWFLDLNFRLSSELKYWSGSCFKSITGLFCLRSWTVQGALSIATYRRLQHNAWGFFVRNSSRSVGFCFLVWHQSILQTRLSVCKTLFILGRTVHERTFVDDRHWVSISRERRAMVAYMMARSIICNTPNV